MLEVENYAPYAVPHVCGDILQTEFREDLKSLFEKAAVGGKPVTFLFNDNQVRSRFQPSLRNDGDSAIKRIGVFELHALSTSSH